MALCLAVMNKSFQSQTSWPSISSDRAQTNAPDASESLFSLYRRQAVYCQMSNIAPKLFTKKLCPHGRLPTRHLFVTPLFTANSDLCGVD